MEDRRAIVKQQSSVNKLTSSTSRVNSKSITCQNCSVSGDVDCSCRQTMSIGLTDRIDSIQVKSPLKSLPVNQNVR
jgi:hypothetical protein